MYIGNREIKSTKPSERKTILDGDVVEVEFKDGKKQEFNSQVFEWIKDKDKSDLTLLRDKFCLPITGQILKIITDYEVPLSYVEFIFQKVSQSLNVNLDLAEDKLWGKVYTERTLKDTNDILTRKE